MRLYDLLQAYEFDEIMPVIVDMFPGTGKFREQLREAWDLLLSMKPVPTKKGIKYKLMPGDRADEQYVGAEDRDFDAPGGDPWQEPESRQRCGPQRCRDACQLLGQYLPDR